MRKEDEVTGIIEDVVGKASLVDKGREVYSKHFAPNAPSFDPEKRKFLKYVAVLAGLYASEQLLKGCSTIQEPVTFQGKTYSDWEAYLLTQDWIRGPDLLVHPRNNLPNDFQNHVDNPINQGHGAVDYDVLIGTPITPVRRGVIFTASDGREGGKVLYLNHFDSDNEPTTGSVYAHLSDRVYQTRGTSIDLSKVIAFSGNTGIGPGGGRQTPHLHLGIYRREHDGTYRTVQINGKTLDLKYYVVIKPGLDPFTLGINGGKPVYWDAKTELVEIHERKRKLQESLDTLDKRVRESDLDNTTKEEILKRRSNPENLRDYLGMLVLRKHRDKDGKMNYRYLPGKLPYALMLEIFSRTSNQEFVTLPFISPFVKNDYQQANPGMKL